MKPKKLLTRSRLRELSNQKYEFIADYQKDGYTTISESFPDRTVCLQKLRLRIGENIADHIWVRMGQINNIEMLKECTRGDSIIFTAVPYRYFSETGRKISSEKYSLGDITIMAIKKKGDKKK